MSIMIKETSFFLFFMSFFLSIYLLLIGENFSGGGFIGSVFLTCLLVVNYITKKYKIKSINYLFFINIFSFLIIIIQLFSVILKQYFFMEFNVIFHITSSILYDIFIFFIIINCLIFLFIKLYHL